MQMQTLGRWLWLVSAAFLASGAAAADYGVVERWDLGPAKSWDFATFDPMRHRVFLTHGDRVVVVDDRTGRSVGEIAGTAGVHDVVLAQDLKLGFTTNGKANTVTVFDLDTLKPRQDIAVDGKSPDAAVYEPAVHKLFVFNGRSNSVSIIDVATLKQVATRQTSGKPESAQSDGSGKIFFNIESEPGQIQVLDAATDRILSTWNLDGCVKPTGLALDRVGGRLFSTCDNRILVVTDARTGRRVATLPIGDQPDAAAFDDTTATIYSANGGDGTLTAVHEDDPDHYHVVANVVTEKNARTLALDPDSQRVFLPAVVGGSMHLLVVAPR